MMEKWTQVASCDGVFDLYESRGRKPHFVFWCITMSVMLIASVFFTIKTIYGFFDTPTITNYVTVNFERMPMPHIALCYNGGMNGSAMKQAGFSDQLIYILSADYTYIKNQSVEEELKNYLASKNFTVIQLYKQFGFTCNDTIEAKFQAGDYTYTDIGCKDVTEIAAPIHGMCMVFKDNGYQYWPGSSGGMYIRLKSPSNSVSEIMPPDLMRYSGRSNSYLLNVEKKLYFLNDKPVLIPMNTNTEIVLQPVHHIRLPQGEPCSDDDTFVSSNVCFHKCFRDNYYNSCGCMPFRYYNEYEDGETKVCTPFEDNYCEKYNDKKTVSCQLDCSPPCDEWAYDLTLSFSAVNTHIKSFAESTATIKIGLHKMQYTQVEEVNAFTYDMVIANVGGQVGLWLGCSVITIIQLFYYIWISLCSKFNQNRIKVTPEPELSESRMK